MSSLRSDVMLLTHGGGGLVVGAAVLLDGVLTARWTCSKAAASWPGLGGRPLPLLAELRPRVLGGPPASPHEWIVRAAAFAPHRIACELIAAGFASPLGPRFQRQFTLSVDARAEADARGRIASDPALAGLLYVAGLPTGDPLPPATYTLPDAARTILQTLRSASVGDSLAARIAG